jgi:ribosome-associated translation inhibitor RaiA
VPTQQVEKASFAAHTHRVDKRRSGRTAAPETQLAIRGGGHEVDGVLRAWIFDRLGRQLGKYAPQIERINVRFSDMNGPRGGVDKCCTIQVVLSGLPTVVVEERGAACREAFDLAAVRCERATRRAMQKHGFSARTSHKNGAAGQEVSEPEVDPTNEEALNDGHGSARNLKLNTAGMSYALEDSDTDRPSRKSTRGSSNRIKPDNPLTRRTKAKMQTPEARATRRNSN